MITTDKSIRYQQNLSGRRLSLLVLSTNDWAHIREFKELVVSTVSSSQGSAYVELEIPFS